MMFNWDICGIKTLTNVVKGINTKMTAIQDALAALSNEVEILSTDVTAITGVVKAELEQIKNLKDQIATLSGQVVDPKTVQDITDKLTVSVNNLEASVNSVSGPSGQLVV
jgi:peptidoglycan hydrolase CwlO-like protein